MNQDQHTCSYTKSLEVVKFLIENGSDVNITNWYKRDTNSYFLLERIF